MVTILCVVGKIRVYGDERKTRKMAIYIYMRKAGFSITFKSTVSLKVRIENRQEFARLSLGNHFRPLRIRSRTPELNVIRRIRNLRATCHRWNLHKGKQENIPTYLSAALCELEVVMAIIFLHAL